MVVSTIMEIYDWDTLTPFELNRQKNIIRNYEFMKACGEFVCSEVVLMKTLVLDLWLCHRSIVSGLYWPLTPKLDQDRRTSNGIGGIDMGSILIWCNFFRWINGVISVSADCIDLIRFACVFNFLWRQKNIKL